MNNILITGGTGFLGSHIVMGLLRKYPDVKIKTISRNENEVVKLMVTCSGDKRVHPIIGDIRDNPTLCYALRDVDSVIHLAAMKHIDLCETNAEEAVNTNVRATMNLLNLFCGQAFLTMSTDKVVGAAGCYGATKLVAEKLTLEKAQKHTDCRYMIVRSGNIFGSTGSVIPKWKAQIADSNRITITAEGITRFFIDPVVLADFMIEILEHGESGKIYIPEQVTISLQDLAKAVVDVYGNKKTKIEITGLREGEKMHESLFSAGEKNIVTQSKVKSSDDERNNTRERAIYKVKRWLNQGE